MKALSHALALAGCLWIAAGEALALCPSPTPKVCSVFFQSDAVYRGKVIAKKPPPEGQPDGLIEFTVAVEEIYRGSPKPVETVYSENTPQRWSAEVGERRVVFARDSRVRDQCSTIDDPRYVWITVREVRAVQAAKGATIEGIVVRGNGPDAAPDEGVEVTAAGPGRPYRARSDRRGVFWMKVWPGRYRIDSPDLVPADSSRGDLRGFDLAKGQCAQFRLSRRMP